MGRLLVTGLRWLLGLVLAAVLALAIVMSIIGRENTWAALFGPPPDAPVDFATLSPRPTPNSFLLCPADLCRNRPPDRVSPVYAVDRARLTAVVRGVIEATEGVRRRADAPPAPGEPDQQQFAYVAVTPWLQFPDLITVRILETGEGGVTFAIYSHSVYGRRDFGANEKRLTAWLDEIERQLAQ